MLPQPKEAARWSSTFQEFLDATLVWNCAGGKKGKEFATHKIKWNTNEKPFVVAAKDQSVADAHTYGMSGLPDKGGLDKARKAGFDLEKCNWNFEQNYNATTSTQAGSKLFHRCTWGFHYKSENQVKKGSPNKNASVSYFGVDKTNVTS